MKNLIVICLLLLQVACSDKEQNTNAVVSLKTVPERPSQPHIIGVSPNLPPELSKELQEVFFQYFLTEIQNGDSIAIYNALDCSPVTNFVYKSSGTRSSQTQKGKLKELKHQLQAVLNFLKNNSGQDCLVDYPRFLDMVAGEFGHLSGKKSVLLLGSPLYSSDDASFSTAIEKGLYPAESCLYNNKTTHPLGCSDRANQLKDFDIHIGLIGYKDEFSGRHTAFLNSHFGLFCQLQSGQLSSFTSWKGALARYKSGATSNKKWTIDSKAQEEEAVILRVQRKSALSFIIDDLPAQTTPEVPVPVKTSGSLRVGAKWTSHCDYDLSAYHKKHPKEITYFRKKKSSFAKYYKDHISGSGSFEIIEFTKSVKLDDIELYINLYSGVVQAGNNSLIIRLEFNGKTYQSKISFPAGTRGDKAKNFGKRKTDTRWYKIPLKNIILTSEQ